jgi:ATP diphosphatase
MEATKDISRLLEIMVALRDKDNGCPWDIVQTFETIKPYTIEEAYEVADAIERADMEDLCDELGDLLLQVVFHAQIAAERGDFEFGDVVEAVNRKMIRRHPHIFGDADNMTPDEVKQQWSAIKTAEKLDRKNRRATRGYDVTEDAKHLSSVPRVLPSLTEALKLQEQAARVGFDWSDAGPILDKVEEEIAELREAIALKDDAAISDELGDLIFALVNVGRHKGVDPENALRGTNTKFRRRFNYIEANLHLIGKDLQSASLDEMEALWQEAKTKERT